jgi:polar amino acid transport system substrate-binding protein
MYKILFILLSIFSLSTAAKAEEVITIVADEWCPYNCKPNSEKPGYGIEIAQEIFSKNNIKVEYINLPWDRAIQETREGNYNAVIGANRLEAEGFVFPEERIGYSVNYFFVKEESNWQFNGISSLENVSLGVIDGYSYNTELDGYIEKNKTNPDKIQVIDGEIGLVQNFRKLEMGRIDVFVENQAVAANYINENRIIGIKSAGQMMDENREHDFVYIAFSPKNPNSQKYAEMLSKGIKEMRENGKLQEILDQYYVTDWALQQVIILN